MIYKCKCGRIKSGQPFNSSVQKPWLCDNCKLKPKVIHSIPRKPSAPFLKRKSG